MGHHSSLLTFPVISISESLIGMTSTTPGSSDMETEEFAW